MEPVHGTDGTRFDPDSIKPGAALDIWVGELYRTLKVCYKEQVDFSGVDVLRFEIVSILTNVNFLDKWGCLVPQLGLKDSGI